MSADQNIQNRCLKIISPSHQAKLSNTSNAHDDNKNSMLDLFIYIHHIYRTEGASAATGRLSGSFSTRRLSGSFSDREMHFSSRLTQEAASTLGFLTAHAVIHDPGLMFAEIIY